ncbi:hypothetical protein HYH03_001978 [Edaphochlamys debaryana]|uniref:AB hydrolase-1 domain-containing protein n=1 Tax=Edaphochlamys debaryana TaxID=47281 RepID=A0A835YEV4_9CHLO|nr:hypothetical protein HYH03_001978 [Edaphochlamys debaryana]|eukprot:KAG2500407.1 hypothetical protein HYH03_001978 [Edaphochlamys debaryana]
MSALCCGLQHRRPFTSSARPCRQRAVVVRSAVGAAPSPVTIGKHTLPDGAKLELVSQKASGTSSGRPPLLFVHGSYHAAWCWQENFLPYFSARGYDAYAVSMRAQGGSDPAPPGTAVAGTLDTLAADVASVVTAVQAESGGRAPVVVGHSFGGLIVQKYVLASAAPGAPASLSPGSFPPLPGVGFVCSVPHTGNKQLVMRFLMRDPIFSFKLTWGFVARSFARSVDACRELFFSADIPRDQLERYQKLLAAASPTRLIDLKDMNAQVPLPAPPAHAPPALVLGGTDDAVVDVQAVKELAAYYGVSPVVLQRMAHDCMLDTRWEETAQALEGWLAKL